MTCVVKAIAGSACFVMLTGIVVSARPSDLEREALAAIDGPFTW